MSPIVPPPLVPGDRIGVAAPGGPIRREMVDRGMAYLQARGFRPVEGRNLGLRHAYLAGDDHERLDDLNGLIADPDLRAIWFARGGYGSARIVQGVDFAALRRYPKALIGYSDITVLQSAAWTEARLQSFHGPLVSEIGDPARFDEASLWHALSATPGGQSHAIPAASVVRSGAGDGPLLGGCLSLLVSLIGTPYEPPLEGAILFWEEVNEEPYRIDRMLGHLRLSGRLARLRGMIVGRLVGCDAEDPAASLPLAEILAMHLAGTEFPVVVDFPAGHCAGKKTLPIGRAVRLDTNDLSLTISAR
ncbi:MAG TPA: LD-carboxypeptidase [Candidatus Polarisedimenticolia bacterium]|nr:LD-carboxypeptidase [Candidatus Polarisedimenticolia bacterium]